MTVSAALQARDKIRVMVVDDSSVVRGLITSMLNEDPEIRVASVAANGAMALVQIKTTPVDVVVLDIEMPVMDGLTALPRLLAEAQGVKILMASTLTRRNADISLKAMTLGAADYVAKPESALGQAQEFKRDLVEKVRALGRAKQRSDASSASVARPHLAPVRVQAPKTRAAPTAIAIGSSTGGPQALVAVLEHLRDLRQPLFITQHMPAMFTAMLAEQLTRIGGRPCAEGVDGEAVREGRTYVAPGGFHMLVEAEGRDKRIRLTQDEPENFCRPAVDPMFRSFATAYGSSALAIVLTGMGSDGAKGCEAIAAAQGRFIVQDEASSVVWGMPGAAARTGLAEEILPLAQIGPWVRRAAGISP